MTAKAKPMTVDQQIAGYPEDVRKYAISLRDPV